ncbi:MAG TPA: aldo/keto reductase [Myxococcales bacterium]|jgi:diketogulonate reductase-like aldo/keto reductase|nr:aldo/keto reductase [Myxococcales bacterium]
MLYGTAWKEDRTAELVRLALLQGFRGIDTANQRRHYHEAAVGEAVAAFLATGKVTREGLFLQTKFTYVRSQDERLPYDPKAGFAEQVRQSFASSLEHLQTDYVDSYLLHGPSTSGPLAWADWEVWETMQSLKQARKIGVSNVSLAQLTELTRKFKPAFVQNRCYARTGWDREVRAFCRANEITYQGFSLLTANARELSQTAVRAVVARSKRTLPQVVFRFALQLGMLPLSGTTTAAHMSDDLHLDFELTGAEVRAIENIAG